MTNRNMTTKVLKIKKLRRSFPKNYAANYVTVGRRPNQEILAGYKERAKSLAFDEAFWDWVSPPRFKGVPPARYAVLQQIEKLEERFPLKLCFSIISTSFQKCLIFFNSEKTCFVVVHVDYVKGIFRRSLAYSNKERAVSAWNTSKVRWVEHSSFTNMKQDIVSF